jgi:thiosulfate dehydrogenase [quinone] large subunit
MLNPNQKLSNAQVTALLILRVVIGWHFLYEGITKLLNPNWTSVGYLMDSKGFLSGFYHSLAASPKLLPVIDALNEWGLVLIGVALIMGLLTRWAIYGGMLLLAMYYFSHPPFIGLTYALPSEGSYLFIDKVVIEFFAMWVLSLFPTGKIIGFDRLLVKTKSN